MAELHPTARKVEERLRARGLDVSVQLHADLTCLAALSVALARARVVPLAA